MANELPEGLIEAWLFAADGPLPRARMSELLAEDGLPAIEAEAAIDDFLESYRERSGGLMVVEVAGGYQLCTRPELEPWVRRLRTRREKVRLSRAALETLAIVAYKQPVITPEIDRIRGVQCGQVLKTLMEKGLVRVLGRMDVPGKPLMYGTTPEFLLQFGLRDLASLPTLAEIQELYAGGDGLPALTGLSPVPASSGPDSGPPAEECPPDQPDQDSPSTSTSSDG